MKKQSLQIRKRDIRRVIILAFEQSLEMGVAMSRDILFAACAAQKNKLEGDDRNPGRMIEVATQDGKSVHTFNGSIIVPDCSMEVVEKTDLVIVSGIWGDIPPFLNRHRQTVSWLRHHADRGALIGCLSTGTFLLAETGLLDGQAGTVYWRMVDEFRKRYPRVILQPERLITAAGNLFCSAGVASGCSLSIYLIERIWGMEIAQKVSQNFLMDIHPVQSISHFAFDGQKYHGDQQVLEAQRWMEMNFSSDFLIEEVANKFGMSLRNFARRFKDATGDTPIYYLQRIRTETAKELLKTDPLSIEEIGCRVGYEDVSFFCRLFKRLTSLTPSAYRQGFQSRS
ncbi:MAG: helix-turn-helix domain-containing protein [Proteobacteria bacterium]|nr:helix-turn-helix domain-containing protein [Pseudomonadota bacterium]